MKLQTKDWRVHLARVSALDCMVTRVIASMQRKSRLANKPLLDRLFGRIRADEGKHVRITRDLVLDMQDGAEILAREKELVAEEFINLLRSDAAHIESINVSPEQLFRHLHHEE